MVEKKKKNSKSLFRFIYSILYIYFLFFGYIANTGGDWRSQHAGNKLLFVYTTFVNFRPSDHFTMAGLYLPHFINIVVESLPAAFALVILILIGINQGYREDFLINAIKKTIEMVPIIIIMSWVWFAIAYKMSVLLVLAEYFTSIHGYLNIAVLTLFYVSSGILGGYLKIRRYRKRNILQLNNAGLLTEKELRIFKQKLNKKIDFEKRKIVVQGDQVN